MREKGTNAMSQLNRVRAHVIALLLAAGLATASATPAFASEQHRFDVPATEARAAIREFAAQAKVQVMVDGDNVARAKLNPVSGDFSTEEGLKILLAQSGLRVRYIGDRSIALVREDEQPTSAKAVERNIRVAQARGARDSEAERRGESAAAPEVEEVVVTAQKKQERLQDVPVPVTAIDGDVLVNGNQLRLQDYYSSVPAMNFTQDFRGGPVISIRGISSGALSNPTIGIVVDDVPFGSSTSLGGGFTAPDFDPSDLARLEVLRGPQGTLYGANSIGGLVKYVTIDPSTDRLGGRVQAGLSSVHNGDGVGYSIRSAINVPLGDTWAVRASGFTRSDPGYIDNPVLGIDGINRAQADGGRLSLSWQLSDDLSLKLNAIAQNSSRDGSAEADLRPGLGDLQQNFPRGTGTYDSHIRFYSATFKARLGSDIELTSLSGYSENSWSDNPDYSFGPWPGYAMDSFGVSATSLSEDNETRKFSQEIRLAVALSERLDWLIGTFYTHEKTDWHQLILALDPASGAVAGAGLDYTFGPTTYEEYAAFTDLTVKVNDRFDVQFGARQSRNKQKHDEKGVYDFFGGFVFAPDTTRTEADAFTYLVTPRFKLSSDLMVYARLASGYRAGGPNYLTAATNFPLDFQPDKTQNYEVGVKGSILGRMLSYDASVYYIDWKDLQVIVSDPPTNLTGYTNAGRARSQGVEISVESRPLTGLTIAAWLAWNDAKLTEDFPQGGALSGDPLPYTSRWSGNLSLEQEFPIAAMTGFAGASVNYVDDRAGSFATGTQLQPTFPSYVRIDLRAGLRLDDWAVNLFINNIADRRGVLNINPNFSTAVSYIQPRTVGMSLSRDF